jgi:hypothetical protein
MDNNKRSDMKLPLNSSHKLSDIINNNKKEDSNKETDDIKTNSENNRDEYNLNSFGENYIKKYTKTENDNDNYNDNDLSKRISQSVDSIENGVPVLNNDTDLEEEDNSFINNNININEINNINCEIKESNNNINNININTNVYDNKNNKEIILNKMKKMDFNLPKKKNKNKDINKLLDLIKNSYQNINKNMKNKVIKNTTNNIDNADVNKIKMKNSNSLDINYEISRNLENEPINLYSKMLNNHNIMNSLKNANFINTNFNAYIENNKFNNKINNNYNSNTLNNKSHQNNKKPLNRKNFFSNPNLSSNQEGINGSSNEIYNIKQDLKSFIKKDNGLIFKSKTLSKDKEKNKKTGSYSKKKKITKKYTGNITNRRKPIKENAKKQFVNFKTRINLNKKTLSTPNTIDAKQTNYLKLKSCQTPPTKRLKNTDKKLTIFSDWLTTTTNKESRNVYTTRDHYYKKKKKINKAGKSVSELTIDKGKKSDLKILLSKSNYKKIKPNCIAKNIKLDMKNKLIKDSNKKTKKITNHNYFHSIKTVIQPDMRKNNYLIKNTINNNNKNINNCRILTRINKTLSKKQLKGIKNYNIINTINDYNFNNNSNIKKFINNTFQNFKYDSTENSKSEDKLRKITTQRQLSYLPKSKNITIKNNKSSVNKIIEYRYGVSNKNPKILLDNSRSNQSCHNDNGSNININNLININNYQKNKNNNIKNVCNIGIKNSRYKKNKIINKLKNNNTNIIANNKRLVNFSNELTNYYLNTDTNNNNNINNLTYSNYNNNQLSLNNNDINSDEKIIEESLINIFNKIFIFFNKEKLNEIILLDSFYKKKMTIFPEKIKKVLNDMIEILYKNMRKKNNIANTCLNSNIRNNNENWIKIDKKTFINEMLFIYKYYLSTENKKMFISNKEDINKIIDMNFFKMSKNNNNKNEIINLKSYKKQNQYKAKTEIKNNT